MLKATLVCTLCAGLTLVACGGDDEPSTDNFLADLNAACAETQQQFEEAASEAGFEPGDEPQSQQEAIDQTQVQVETGEELQSRLEGLEPSEEDAEAFDAYVAARDQVVQARQDALEAAEADDQEAFGEAQRSANQAAIEAEERAAELDATECSTGPSGGSEIAVSFDEAQRALQDALNEADESVNENLESGDLDAVQGDAASVRDALFEFDATVRELDFPSEVSTEVNALLTANRQAIASLDAVAEAQDVGEAGRLVQRTFEEVGATNDAAAELSQALGKLEE